jgi:hypothetical protein
MEGGGEGEKTDLVSVDLARRSDSAWGVTVQSVEESGVDETRWPWRSSENGK